MKTPTIDKLQNTGTELIATIEGQEVPLHTFRETLWKQGAVYLPPPFTDRCSLAIFSDPDDDESDYSEAAGCILDREVAAWMADFAAGKLKAGILRG